MALKHYSPYPLKAHNTFGFDETAQDFWTLGSDKDLPALIAALRQLGSARGRPLLIGGGSNLLICGAVSRPVVQFGFKAVHIVREDEAYCWVEAQAGMAWHEFVLWTLAQGLSGLENLALIPGTVGAAPVQNIGAYGVELKDCFDGLQAVDISRALSRDVAAPDGELPVCEFKSPDCAFGYRDSVFKRQPDWWITSVRFKLSRQPRLHLDYGDIQAWLKEQGIRQPGPRDVAHAVIAIRRSKLPDPAVLGNAGSFFKNPIVPQAQAQALLAQHPGLPSYDTGQTGLRKLSAAWLIDQCGLKGWREGDAGVHQAHALVLVNYGSATGSEVLRLARSIQASVQARFAVDLEPEPFIIQG